MPVKRRSSRKGTKEKEKEKEVEVDAEVEMEGEGDVEAEAVDVEGDVVVEDQEPPEEPAPVQAEDTPVQTEEEVKDDVAADAAPGTADSASNGSPAKPKPLTDVELKKHRAKRFGIPLNVSAEEKARLRKERFGTFTPEDKKAQRQKRFGLGVGKADTKYASKAMKEIRKAEKGGSQIASEEKKKQLRRERFGNASTAKPKIAPMTEADKEKLAERAKRFGLPV
eukprot:CAMPEP_0119136318 /NCGR_PEP_ID=MMETSP1310-20130426/21178_1 /TAXON_ID=464262 /ORGANISM="Genus nov. species nov., Strain RCC2339" /LENGTH=223 /DNA_ID=CAMNT_0007127297 /DNA_START=34 /DNA_END=705 /DNA_ORIENTATION=+